MRRSKLTPWAIAGLPIALLASVVTLPGEARATGNFSPRVSARYSSTDAGSHPDVATTYSIGLGPDRVTYIQQTTRTTTTSTASLAYRQQRGWTPTFQTAQSWVPSSRSKR